MQILDSTDLCVSSLIKCNEEIDRMVKVEK